MICDKLNSITIIFKLVLIINLFYKAKSIGCYKCSTLSNQTACVDPFNPGSTLTDFYEPDCRAGIQDRIGLFPARYCLKVSGTVVGTGEQLVIRTCTVTKLLDSDASHSSFTLQLDEKTNIAVTSGLIASCKDDGCNAATRLSTTISKHDVYARTLLLAFAVYCLFLTS